MNTISILGSGWLGLPLAQHFLQAGYTVNASTTSDSRVADIESIGANPFIVDIDSFAQSIENFLKANILIINIPSKNIDGFSQLLHEIEKSDIENVLFVSSTSVYQETNTTITESDGVESVQSPLLNIENLFRSSGKFKTTIVRFGGLIGYSRKPGMFFRKGKSVRNADSNVNLIHHDDCIGIINGIIEQEVWGDVFNCCADTHPTKREFYTLAAESIGRPAPEFESQDTRSFKIISNQKVKRVLGYTFKYPDLMNIEFNESR
ncbi:NAD(P)-binding domain-containing protein [Pseudohongiella sp. O18]|uniref:NAD(P)-binding domain-containing protein n=1 Tax=Pseudohongiella sp. O18 TaxID=2904248 RepID=UPI001F006FE7|nr:NAD(P)H-binding protein [Pseudohongiella sp. O18]